MPRPSRQPPAASIAASEVARFAEQAGDWWNPDGKFRPLHRLNPVRIGYLRDRIAAHYECAIGGRQALAGLSVLDVGCGGGLVAEPLARLGAAVTGLDAAEPAIAVARAHAAQQGLTIAYRAGSVEELARTGQRFDVVTALEIIEHVADRDSFCRALAQLVKPGGLLILSTLNRTPRSWLLGIVAAEYVLGWVPRGTHDWRQFVRPSELAAAIGPYGLRVVDVTGLVFNPLANDFRLSRHDLAVNYFMTAVKA